MFKVFNDLFERDADIIKEFEAPTNALDGAKVLYARYQYEDYDGEALVLFEKDGKLFEVYGSHCSCYGLEGQWEPQETTWDALRMRRGEHDPDIRELYCLYSPKNV
jgi:hypothetical protein